MTNFTALEYLYIAVANAYGLDKETFETRIKWTKTHLETLELHTEKADDPCMYTAAVMALRDTQAGKPTGFMVGLDSSASGVQIMSAITGCYTGCVNTGLIEQDVRHDLYNNATSAMNNLLGSDIDIPRKDVKQAVMTHFYASIAAPEKLFGKGTEALTAFYEAVNEIAPEASNLVDILVNSWQQVDTFSWVLPDDHTAYIPNKVTKQTRTKVKLLNGKETSFTMQYKVIQAEQRGLHLAANVIHSIDGFVVREMNRRCNYDPEVLNSVCTTIKLFKAMCDPSEVRDYDNVVSLVHAERIYNGETDLSEFTTSELNVLLDNIEEVLEHKPFPLICIHDEFKAHANNINQMRNHYGAVLSQLSASQIISDIISQIRGYHYQYPKRMNIAPIIREQQYGIN